LRSLPEGAIDAGIRRRRVNQVHDKPTEVFYPAKRSLVNARGVRNELVRLYTEIKAELIDPVRAGRLIACLNTIQAMDNGTLADQRLTEIEERLALIKPNGHANGHGLNGRVARR
jgi:hypothetical protein